MKKLKISPLAPMIAIVLGTVSCSKDLGPDPNAPVAVNFTSGVTATPQSRVGMDASSNSVWEEGDPIGIYMVEHGTTDIVGGGENIPYTAAGGGSSTSFTTSADPIIYPQDETVFVDFIAYHPYNASVTGYLYPINLSNQSSQSAIDLMVAVADKSGTGYNKDDGRGNTVVNFRFDHQLVKLQINAIPGPGVNSDLSSMNVGITGMLTTADFDLKGVTGITRPRNPGVITPFRDGRVIEAILLPVTSLDGTHEVTFKVDGYTYVWEMWRDISSLEPGKIYSYNITLNKYAVEATGSINSWIIGSYGGGIAD